MQGGSGSGRSIYVFRRVFAALVVLLLLVLLVPWAWQALVSDRGQGTEEAPETEEQGSVENDKEGAVDESAQDVAKQEELSEERSEDEDRFPGRSQTARNGDGTTDPAEEDGDEEEEASGGPVVETSPDRLVPFARLGASEEPVGGGMGPPVFTADVHPAAVEPVVLELPPGDVTPLEAPVLPASPGVLPLPTESSSVPPVPIEIAGVSPLPLNPFAEPAFLGEPVFFDEVAFAEGSLLFEEPPVSEEQIIVPAEPPAVEVVAEAGGVSATAGDGVNAEAGGVLASV